MLGNRFDIDLEAETVILPRRAHCRHPTRQLAVAAERASPIIVGTVPFAISAPVWPKDAAPPRQPPRWFEERYGRIHAGRFVRRASKRPACSHHLDSGLFPDVLHVVTQCRAQRAIDWCSTTTSRVLDAPWADSRVLLVRGQPRTSRCNPGRRTRRLARPSASLGHLRRD